MTERASWLPDEVGDAIDTAIEWAVQHDRVVLNVEDLAQVFRLMMAEELGSLEKADAWFRQVIRDSYEGIG